MKRSLEEHGVDGDRFLHRLERARVVGEAEVGVMRVRPAQDPRCFRREHRWDLELGPLSAIRRRRVVALDARDFDLKPRGLGLAGEGRISVPDERRASSSCWRQNSALRRFQGTRPARRWLCKVSFENNHASYW